MLSVGTGGNGGVVIVALALLVTLVPACHANPGGGARPSELIVLVGSGYFTEYCASCHGSDARGNGPASSALEPRPADLTKIAQRRDGEFNATEVAAIIDGRTGIVAHGTREMPIWGRRFADQAGTDSLGSEIVRGRLLILVEYLRSIQK